MHTPWNRNPRSSGDHRTGKPKAVVVVPVVWIIPVAVRRAEVPWIVVPGPAAKNTTTRGRSGSAISIEAPLELEPILGAGVSKEVRNPQKCGPPSAGVPVAATATAVA